MHSKFLNFWKLEIEDRVIINQYCLLDCRKHKIHIANDSDIGAHTFIWTLGHDINNDNHDLYGGDVNIGHHVWIASRVTILPGLSIADGSVIASASVVTKNVEYLEVVAGNPAKVIKHRKNNLKYTITYQPFFE
ncbi:MAG: acyltransferase [Ignavibacteriae bacterium]|nr:acyltransferase [Ignavibacteriota bacterium]